MVTQNTPPLPMYQSPDIKAELNASTIQIAMLNNKLPRGFRFELYDTIKKNEPTEFKTGKRKKMVTIFSSNPKLLAHTT